MNKTDQELTMGNNGEISVSDLIANFKKARRYILSKWVTVFILTVIGCLLGLGYSFISKPTFTASTTFVLEDSNKGGMGQYAGLAAIAGINLDNSGGLFQSDNITQLYTSRLMIKKTLLTKRKFDSSGEALIVDRYIAFNKLHEKWADDPKLANLNFNGNNDALTRTQDSIITDIVEEINKKNLRVDKLDTKSSIIKVEVVAKDELFAQVFTNVLVDNVNSFYIRTKTKRANDNLSVLQEQSDSVRRVLDASLFGVASSIDAAPNANPNFTALRVPSQKKQVDVQANTAIYAEIVKNKEIAKMNLMQEKPLIQVIDEPVLPLKKSKVGKMLGTIAGGFLFGLLAVVIIFLKRPDNLFS